MKRSISVVLLIMSQVIASLASAATPQEMVVRRYDVLASFQEITRHTRAELSAAGATGDQRQPPSPDDLKVLFAEMGVEWPPGSYIKHVPGIGKLVVKNTPENLKKFEEILAELNVIPFQIEIEAQFVEFEMADIDTLSRQGMISTDALMGLRKNGKSRLLAAPRVVTKSGSEATVKGMTEYIYPTEFEVNTDVVQGTNKVVAAGGANAPSGTNGGLVEPGGFQTREVGAILSVLPETSPEGSMINLTMTPEYVCEPTWKNYGPGSTNPTDANRRMPMEQPFFHVYTTTTQIALKNGATIMIGGGMNSRDGKKVVYLFVSARLIDIEGKPLKRKQ